MAVRTSGKLARMVRVASVMEASLPAVRNGTLQAARKQRREEIEQELYEEPERGELKMGEHVAGGAAGVVVKWGGDVF